MVDEEAARQALRTAQNSVLGKGKRARGVTVTRSGQEELMKALFPSWQGCFDGVHPSLAGLSNEQIYAVLENGLISDSELKALLHLIQSPDVRCLSMHPFCEPPCQPSHCVSFPISLISSKYRLSLSTHSLAFCRNFPPIKMVGSIPGRPRKFCSVWLFASCPGVC